MKNVWVTLLDILVCCVLFGKVIRVGLNEKKKSVIKEREDKKRVWGCCVLKVWKVGAGNFALRSLCDGIRLSYI